MTLSLSASEAATLIWVLLSAIELPEKVAISTYERRDINSIISKAKKASEKNKEKRKEQNG